MLLKKQKKHSKSVCSVMHMRINHHTHCRLTPLSRDIVPFLR